MQHINKHYTDAGLKAFSKTINPNSGTHQLTTDASIMFLGNENDEQLKEVQLKISKEKIVEYKERNHKTYYNHNFDTRTNTHIKPEQSPKSISIK